MHLAAAKGMNQMQKGHKEATVRQMGSLDQTRMCGLATSENARLLQRTQRLQISTAAMCCHRFYIGNVARYQFILYRF